MDIRRFRLAILLLASSLAGLVTAFAGPVAFIGLAVPHMARLSLGTSDNRVLLPGGREVVPAEVVVFPAADPASHSVNVRVRLPDLDPPPAPGTTAKVVFDADVGAADGGTVTPLRIPASAVAQRGELSGVYVQQDGRIVLRQLRLGAHAGDSVEVISGLRPGDRVVRDPVAAVQALAARRKAAEGAHD